MAGPTVGELRAALDRLPALIGAARAESQRRSSSVRARAEAAGRLRTLENARTHLSVRLADLTAGEPGKELEQRPVCPSSPTHGRCVFRPARTPDQAWCGAWYDCPEPGCHSSVLFPSAESRAAHAEASLRIIGRA